jgi:hypothetical protein
MANSKKRCKHCKEYVLADSGVKLPAGFFCSMSHAVEFGRAKAKKQIDRQRRAKTKVDKDRIKSLAEVCSEAQKDVNSMIRAADIAAGYRCIASGHQIADCGHFYHAGSKYRTSWLRFHHANLHGQGAHSNRYSGGGDAINYLQGLRDRYGDAYVAELEDFKRVQDHGGWPKPTREEVRALAKWARAMTRIYRGMYE